MLSRWAPFPTPTGPGLQRKRAEGRRGRPSPPSGPFSAINEVARAVLRGDIAESRIDASVQKKSLRLKAD